MELSVAARRQAANPITELRPILRKPLMERVETAVGKERLDKIKAKVINSTIGVTYSFPSGMVNDMAVNGLPLGSSIVARVIGAGMASLTANPYDSHRKRIHSLLRVREDSTFVKRASADTVTSVTFALATTPIYLGEIIWHYGADMQHIKSGFLSCLASSAVNSVPYAKYSDWVKVTLPKLKNMKLHSMKAKLEGRIMELGTFAMASGIA